MEGFGRMAEGDTAPGSNVLLIQTPGSITAANGDLGDAREGIWVETGYPPVGEVEGVGERCIYVKPSFLRNLIDVFKQTAVNNIL